MAGFVYNDSNGVTIEIEGAPAALDHFAQTLADQPPPLAVIEQIRSEELPPCGATDFTISGSRAGDLRQTLIAPDTTICSDCLHELFDPHDRRYRYPFINCTNCGPRFTIVEDIPYDRANTTMRVFPLCAACRREYEDPLDRRFHAQPNACPVCGPMLRFEHWPSQPTSADDPIVAASQALIDGMILAIKGLGGYHLACDATNTAAVSRLRQHKRREAKPFALMVPDLATVEQLCYVDAAEAALLESHAHPIVLLQRRNDAALAPDIAPGHTTLGVMLPYTPLHHLMLHGVAQQRPAQPVALVMTSGNLSDEPIAYDDADARQRLAAIAEGMLSHNRTIHMRCDDSVARIAAGGIQLVRRARGYTPAPLPLAFTCPTPMLAAGGQQKHTFCLGKQQQAFLSQHIGDLENLETLTAFHEGIAHFQRLFDITPQAVAYDLHPDYMATQAARALQLPHAIGVQHHHAHIASVLAEHGVAGPVVGIAADGSGYGSDGAIWGCEVLLADLAGFTRLAHLAYLPLAGGEQAIRQPWRMAATYLAHTYGNTMPADIPFVRQLDQRAWRVLTQMIERGLNCPPTSSLGRLFDAVAALIGLRGIAQYEGQAAIELEMIAEPQCERYPFAIGGGTPAQLDVRPMIVAIVADLRRGVAMARIAGRFHATLSAMLSTICMEACRQTGLTRVALSGGVFQNRLLLESLTAQLEQQGCTVLLNRRVPANDGGLSLGQLAIAATQLAQGSAARLVG